MKWRAQNSINLDLHAEIKNRLKKSGSSFSKIARELGVDAGTVTVVSHGYRRSRRIESAIAEKLGTTPEVVWPERYRKDDELDQARDD